MNITTDIAISGTITPDLLDKYLSIAQQLGCHKVETADGKIVFRGEITDMSK